MTQNSLVVSNGQLITAENALDCTQGEPYTSVVNSSATKKRPNPYIWVTWLTKLMAGENQCEWASWFSAHHRYTRLASDTELIKWKSDHNELLHKRVDQLEAEGFTVYIEDENSFKVDGNQSKACIAGKPDIIAIKDGQFFVEDCKTGQPKESDQIQVLIYMLLLPLVGKHEISRIPEGRLVYNRSVTNIPSSRVDNQFKELFKQKVTRIGSLAPARKVPSFQECRFCSIPAKLCPERIEVESNTTTAAHDLF